ncbi:uncharacterized protein LOC124265158 isoform X2 [Haliotis rubra]|uniref:uncharacterized protein LOC124265158 isoform X2 n=1 Tax=Haliotis rubra TaxID=36100 RepID=UPI001EE5C826|nr:uncharacterized protein LOC124265158 isoform X2 [Haliotis rubra]
MVSLDVAWNCRHLKPPAEHLQRVATSWGITANVDRTVEVLSSAVDIMMDLEFLASELFVLSRFLVKRRNQMRRHKTLQTLSQVEGCLKRYQETDFVGLVCKMHEHFKQVCCRSLYLDCLSWYSSLFPTLAVLPRGEFWLSQTTPLPEDLTFWLGKRLCLDNMAVDPPSTGYQLSHSLVLPPMSLGEDEEEPAEDTSNPLKRSLIVEEDIGAPVSVSRVKISDTVQRMSDTVPHKKKKKSTKHCSETVGTNLFNSGQGEDVRMTDKLLPVVSEPSLSDPVSAAQLPTIKKEPAPRYGNAVVDVPIIKDEPSTTHSGSPWRPQWSSVKAIKRIVHQSNTCNTVLNIFKEFEPKDSINDKSIWDEYPKFSYTDKCQLFHNKLDVIKTCCRQADGEGLSGGGQEEWLNVAKHQCFTYLKGLNAFNKQHVSLMMTLEGLQEMTGELSTGQLTLGEQTWKLNPRDARVLKTKLESCLRKMRKVKQPAKWKPLQNKARYQVMSYIRLSVANKDLKTEATDDGVRDSNVACAGPSMPTRQQLNVLPAQSVSSTSNRNDNCVQSYIRNTCLLEETDRGHVPVTQKSKKKKKKRKRPRPTKVSRA